MACFVSDRSREALGDLGPDYMSRAVSVCRDNFQPGITWGEPARLMADAVKRGRPCLILVRRRHARYIIAGSCSFQNGHYKNAANDRNCLFLAVGCIIFCIHVHGL